MNDKPRRRSAGQSPISAHPAFPAIVALWFAALLGLGSLVLPTALFERVTVASGLAEVYEAARPPLGVTARIAIALAAAALGALAGLAIARKVAEANTPQPVTRRAAALRPAAQPAAAKRPISAHEELGEGGLDAERDTEERPVRHAATGRRRALSMTDESARSDFLDFAPLPGQGHAASEEPLDLIAYEEPEIEPAVARETASAFGSGTLSPLPDQTPMPEIAMTDPIAPPDFVRREDPAPAVEPTVETTASGLGALAMVELVDRFAQALERHRRPAEAIAEPAEAFAPSFSAAPFNAPLTTRLPAEYAAHTPPVPAIPAALRPIGFDDDEAEAEAESPPDLDLTAALTRAAPVTAPVAAPVAAPFAALTLPDEDAIDDDDPNQAGEEGYTSLLAMKSPFGLPREPVRIEDDSDEGDDRAIEPVVIFPGQAIRKASPAADGPSRDAGSSMPGGYRPFDAPLERVQQAAAAGGRPFAAPGSQQAADPGDTERALREALEKLQKMSGVG